MTKEGKTKKIIVNKPENSDIKPLNLCKLKFERHEEKFRNYFFMRFKRLLFIKKYKGKSFGLDFEKLLTF